MYDQNLSTGEWTTGSQDEQTRKHWHAPSPAAPSLQASPSAGLPVLILLSVIFLTTAGILSRLIGVHFTFPQSGDIPGLHTNYWVPPIAAALGYLVLQILVKFVGSASRPWPDLVRNAVTDYFLLGLFILILYVHFNVKMWVPLVNPRLYDQDYFAVDQALRPLIVLFGDLRAAIARVLPWTDIWYQAAFFAVFVLSFLSHALGDRRFHLRNIAAVMLVEMIGVFTYFIAPAVGPFVFESGQNALATAGELRMHEVYQQVREGGAAWISTHGGGFFGMPLAAMPSLHVACSLILAYYAFRARLRITPLAFAAFGWILIESVASRWHYLVDLPVGLLLAVLVIALTNRLFPLGEPAAARPTRRSVPQRHGGAVAEPETRTQPLVWVLRCHRDGDHAQSLALAEALGWPYAVKKTVFHWYEIFFALAGRATLVGLNRRRSSHFTPPWPDIVILAGRQNETPAKWIRKQSGGRAKIVVIGRNWTPPDELDSIITTPTLRLPKHPKVLVNNFPLHQATPARLTSQAESWRPRLTGLSGPYIAVMVGGSSGPYVFSRETARRLGREASMLARSLGASLLVSTSARTGRGAMRALEAAIDVPCAFYRFRRNDPDNPHLGYLALADTVIVTGDSLSMLTEACAAKRSVYIFEFGGGPAAMHGPRGQDPRIRQWWRWSQLKDQGLLGLHYGYAIGLPAWRLNRSRDLRLVQDQLIATGRARWLGDSDAAPVPATLAPPDDLQRAVRRVRSLVLTGPAPEFMQSVSTQPTAVPAPADASQPA